MAEHWVKYIRRYDRLMEDALKLAIKATMQNTYKCVHGDGNIIFIKKANRNGLGKLGEVCARYGVA